VKGIPHAVIGASCGLLVAHLTSRQVPVPALPWIDTHGLFVPDPQIISLAILGSLIPDLDAEHSLLKGIAPVLGPMASRLVRETSTVLNLVRPVHNPFRLAIAGDYLIHRGAFHTPVMASLIALIAWKLGLDAFWSMSLFIGYLSHLVSDAPNTLGIAWFWPMYCWPIRLPIRWHSGNNWIEQPLAVLTLACASYYSWS